MDNFAILIIIFIIVILAIILMFLFFTKKYTKKDVSYDKMIKKANKMVQDILAAIGEEDTLLVLNSKKKDTKDNVIYIDFESRSEREVLEQVILHLSILLSEKHKSYKVRDLKRKIEQASYNLGYLSYSLSK